VDGGGYGAWRGAGAGEVARRSMRWCERCFETNETGQPGGGGPQSPYGPGWAVRKAREVLGLERRNGWGEAQVTVILLLKRTMKNALQTWQNITCDATKKVSTSAPNIPVWGYRHQATKDGKNGKWVQDIQDRNLELSTVLPDLCLV